MEEKPRKSAPTTLTGIPVPKTDDGSLKEPSEAPKLEAKKRPLSSSPPPADDDGTLATKIEVPPRTHPQEGESSWIQRIVLALVATVGRLVRRRPERR